MLSIGFSRYGCWGGSIISFAGLASDAGYENATVKSLAWLLTLLLFYLWTVVGTGTIGLNSKRILYLSYRAFVK